MKNITPIKKIFEMHDNPVVAFSGGKDSTVVLDYVRKHDSSVKAVFCNTGVEHKETLDYVKTIDNVDWLKPSKSFFQCVDDYGWPDLKSKSKSHGNRCCYYLKEKPMIDYVKKYDIDLIFTGLTSDESRNRMMFFKRCGSYYFMKTWGVWKCHPIHDFSEKDVWDYINSNNLNYNSIYDKGAKRCGCSFCTAFCNWKKALAKENPRKLAFILQSRYNQRQLEIKNI